MSAIRLPLFSILWGLHIVARRERPGQESVGSLINDLVQQALFGRLHQAKEVLPTLKRLAIESINRGHVAVLPEVIGAVGEHLEKVLRTRLVSWSDEGLRFPVSLVTNWFGAQSLREGDIEIGSVVEDAELLAKWKDALVILFASTPFDTVSDVIDAVAMTNSGYAASLVSDSIESYSWQQGDTAPSSLECAREICRSMETWVRAIGPLASAIAPLRPNGHLMTAGARKDGEWLVAGWSNEPVAEAVVLPSDVRVMGLEASSAWHFLRGASPSRQPGWAWRWTLDTLTGNLEGLLKSRQPGTVGPTSLWWRERIWEAALGVMDYGSLYPYPIPFDVLVSRIRDVDPGDFIGRMRPPKLQYGMLDHEIRRLQSDGKADLAPPWPSADEPAIGGFIWSPYSSERLLERTLAIYMGRYKNTR